MSLATLNTKVNTKGVALILVLWVIVLLNVIVLEFSYAMRIEGSATKNFKDETDCYLAAQGGFQRAVAELIRNVSVTSDELSDEFVERQKLWRDDQRPIPVEVGNAEAEVMICNESGKFDLNALSEEFLRGLILKLGVAVEKEDVIVDSIFDWRDEDRLHRLNGAEDDYYESLATPYPCKDGPFDTVEELLLVRGVTPELFYGGAGRKGLSDLVTVYSRAKRIDVNTAPREVLLTIPGFTEELVAGIIKERDEKPIKELNLLRQMMGEDIFNQSFTHFGLAPSMVFSIISTGSVHDTKAKRRIKAIVRITPRAQEGFQVIYWADDYPIAENLVSLGTNPWEKEGEELL